MDKCNKKEKSKKEKGKERRQLNILISSRVKFKARFTKNKVKHFITIVLRNYT